MPRLTGMVTDVTVKQGTSANGPWKITEVSVLERKSITVCNLSDDAPVPAVGDTVDYAITLGARAYRGNLSVDCRADGDWKAFELPGSAKSGASARPLASTG